MWACSLFFAAAHFYFGDRQHFSFSHSRYKIFMLFFRRNWSPLFFFFNISGSSSCSVIHANVQHRSQGSLLPDPWSERERPWKTLVTCLPGEKKNPGRVPVSESFVATNFCQHQYEADFSCSRSTSFPGFSPTRPLERERAGQDRTLGTRLANVDFKNKSRERIGFVVVVFLSMKVRVAMRLTDETRGFHPGYIKGWTYVRTYFVRTFFSDQNFLDAQFTKFSYP